MSGKIIRLLLIFSLSGEGESLLHPNVWEFVDYIRNTTKHKVSMITNGSVLTPTNIDNIASKLSSIRVSLDTMDAELAENIGRHFHAKTVEGIRTLAARGMRVQILTTDFGQDISDVRQFVRSLKSPNVSRASQFLQPKLDYQQTYTKVHPIVMPRPRRPSTRVMCGNILSKRLIAYTVDGLKLPCCYIKDRTNYIGYDAIVAQMSNPANTIVPDTCAGCMELMYQS